MRYARELFPAYICAGYSSCILVEQRIIKILISHDVILYKFHIVFARTSAEILSSLRHFKYIFSKTVDKRRMSSYIFFKV